MKKSLIVLAIVIVLGLVGLGIYSLQREPQTGASWYAGGEVLVGSAANLVSVPQSYVEADATTTGLMLRTYADGNTTVDQLVNSAGSDSGLLCIQAIGGTATSTLFIKQMGSIDSSTYFNVGSSTEALTAYATTTVESYAKVISLEPGTATTTGKCFPVDTKGYNNTRFLIYGEDLTTDPNDGVQAFIKYIKIEPTR